MRKISVILFLLLIVVKSNSQVKSIENMPSERFKKGWEKLKEIDGETGEKVIENLKDISP